MKGIDKKYSDSAEKKAVVIKIDDTQKPTKLPGLNKILW